MKILITGSRGFIGRHLAEGLRNGNDVAAPSSAELDLLDEDQVHCYLRRHCFDAVVHAATVRSNRKLGAADNLLHQNCRMFFNLARNRDNFGKLLFFSSGAVYDRRHWVPRLTENHFDLHVPADDYGFSKYICAQFISGATNMSELRLFGVFGPYEDWEIRFLSNACCRAVWDLPILIRQNVYFDYLDVADLSQIVGWFAAAEPQHRAYNVCSGRTCDLATLARKVVRASGKDLQIVVKRVGLGQEYSGDNQRLLREMPDVGFRDIDDSIAVLYGWYLDRKQTIDPARLNFDA